MKLDIEGGEAETLPELAFSGALSFIDFLAIESHSWQNTKSRKEQIIQVSENLSFPICNLADRLLNYDLQWVGCNINPNM